jgi:hypothetical protein
VAVVMVSPLSSSVVMAAMSAKALRSEAALLGKLSLHGRFNFVSEAPEVLMQPAVHFTLCLIGR